MKMLVVTEKVEIFCDICGRKKKEWDEFTEYPKIITSDGDVIEKVELCEQCSSDFMPCIQCGIAVDFNYAYAYYDGDDDDKLENGNPGKVYCAYCAPHLIQKLDVELESLKSSYAYDMTKLPPQ